MRCTWECTPFSLLNAARVWKDERVLMEIEHGAYLHAKDILYHSSCYKAYTSPRQLHGLARKEVEGEDTETETESPYARAFKKLAHKIEESLAANMDSVWKTAELSRVFLGEEGVDGSTYQTHLVKTTLTEHFKERLSFHRPQKE